MTTPSQDEVSSSQETDSTEGQDPASNADSSAVESAPDTPPEVQEQVQPSVLDMLRGEVGLDDDDEELVQLVVDAETEFRAGNFRAAGKLFTSVAERSPSPKMADFIQTRLKRIRPDFAALIVAAVCGIALIVIWILAVGHSH